MLIKKQEAIKKFILTNLDTIKNILLNGKLSDVALYLKMHPASFRKWRKKIPELNSIITEWEGNKLSNRYDSVDKIKSELPQVYEVAKNTGSVKAVEKYFNTTEGGLKFLRKNCRELDEVIKDGRKYYQENRFNKDKLSEIKKIMKSGGEAEVAKFCNLSVVALRYYYKQYPELKETIALGINRRKWIKFFKNHKKINSGYKWKQLNQIQKIAKNKGKIKEISLSLNMHEKTLRYWIKQFPELKLAIARGFNSRDKNLEFWKRSKLKADYIEYNIKQIEKISATTGQYKLVAKFLNINLYALRVAIKKHPQLALAVQRGFAQYKSNKKSTVIKFQDETKTIELFQFKNAPKELVAKIDSIEDIGEENALACYRRMKEEEKETMSHKELKNIDFIGM